MTGMICLSSSMSVLRLCAGLYFTTREPKNKLFLHCITRKSVIVVNRHVFTLCTAAAVSVASCLSNSVVLD